jgi:hypothetical protein
MISTRKYLNVMREVLDGLCMRAGVFASELFRKAGQFGWHHIIFIRVVHILDKINS